MGTVTPLDLSAHTTTAVNGGAGLLEAGTDAFNALWPYALAVIAVVFLSFWVLRRTKKAASSAK